MTAGRILIAYSNASNYVATTAEYLAAFGRHSRLDVRYLHVTYHADINADLDDYDAVLQSYCARLPIEGCVSPEWVERLSRYRGIKILAVQDEYDHTNRLRAAIRDIGFDVVLTCVPQNQIAGVYPPEMFPGTAFVQVLTGYVPEVVYGRPLSLAERPITIGYRGRDIGPRYGRLAFDKLEIGRRMLAEMRRSGRIDHDIAWGEGDRLYGEAWYRWIGQCRVNLATESGSNAFDWDGEIEAEYRRRNLLEHPVGWQSFLEWVAPYERGHGMGQISPRIFEAAAMGTALVCYPGNYSGIIKPWEHYIPLERDFSNIVEVLLRIEDVAGLQAMADRTYAALIASHDYSYRAFVGEIDWLICKSAAMRGLPLRSALEGRDEPPPIVDCAALRSLVERPTRQPQSPLIFAFRQLARENRLLTEALLREKQVASAFGERLRQESAALAEMTAERGARANGHAGVGQ